MSYAAPPPLFKHQVEGVDWLLAHPYGLLGDEMRLGKTRQVIEAAQTLYERGEITRALVVAPAPVRDEWFDPELGQLARYRRSNVAFQVTKYQADSKSWAAGGTDSRYLQWVVTNYDFIRGTTPEWGAPWSKTDQVPKRLSPLLPYCDDGTLIVLDESLAIKSHTSLQTRACWRLRSRCSRIWELNGTPEGDNPGDAYAQYSLLSSSILGCHGLSSDKGRGWFQFRGEYAVEKKQHARGRDFKTIVAWKNLDKLRRLTSPHTLRRTLDQVFDLPPALEPVMITVALKPRTWELYQRMRRDAILQLEGGTVKAPQAGVKVMRLAQITSGFVGGVESTNVEDMPSACLEEVGTEKRDALVEWVASRVAEDPNFKAVVWCRFRAEAEGLEAAIRALHVSAPVGGGWHQDGIQTSLLYGEQRPADRDRAIKLLNPHTSPAGPVVVVGTAKTGGFGLNFAAASTMIYCSNDYSLVTRRQSGARILGPDQKRPASYFDVVATGPAGEKTVDHTVMRALRRKEDIAAWTVGQWAQALKEE